MPGAERRVIGVWTLHCAPSSESERRPLGLEADLPIINRCSSIGKTHSYHAMSSWVAGHDIRPDVPQSTMDSEADR